MTSNLDRLNTVFAAVFGEEAAGLTDGDGMDSVAAWDSASQLDLIMSIEAEFDVQFEVVDFAALTNVGAIREKLQQMIA